MARICSLVMPFSGSFSGCFCAAWGLESPSVAQPPRTSPRARTRSAVIFIVCDSQVFVVVARLYDPAASAHKSLFTHRARTRFFDSLLEYVSAFLICKAMSYPLRRLLPLFLLLQACGLA